MCQYVSANVSLPFWRLQQPAAVRFANMAVSQHRYGGAQIGHGSPILFATIGRVGREPQASGRHQARDLGTNLTRPTDKPLSPSDIKFATVIHYVGRAVAATH